jgi:hypothetical protein
MRRGEADERDRRRLDRHFRLVASEKFTEPYDADARLREFACVFSAFISGN